MLEKSSKIRFDQKLRSLYMIVHDSLCDRLSCILTLPQRHRGFSLINQKDGDLINQKDGDRSQISQKFGRFG